MDRYVLVEVINIMGTCRLLGWIGMYQLKLSTLWELVGYWDGQVCIS